MSEENMICEDVGAIPLIDETSCKAAVEKITSSSPTTYYKKKSNDDDYPKGCYLHDFRKKVYFNTHESGARSEYGKPICKLPKW